MSSSQRGFELLSMPTSQKPQTSTFGRSRAMTSLTAKLLNPSSISYLPSNRGHKPPSQGKTYPSTIDKYWQSYTRNTGKIIDGGFPPPHFYMVFRRSRTLSLLECIRFFEQVLSVMLIGQCTGLKCHEVHLTE